MKNIFKRIRIFSISALILISAFCAINTFESYGAHQYYTSTLSFKSTVTINRNNTANYKNSVSMYFADAVDSFIYQIPEELSTTISDVDVSGYEYSYNKETNQIVIWKDNVQLLGRKNFNISYVSSGVNNHGKIADYINAEILGNNWQYDIEHLVIKIKYHDGFEWVKLKKELAGYKGDCQEYGEWNLDNGGRTIKFNGYNIPPYSNARICFELPLGYWANSTSIGITRNFAIIMLCVGLLVFAVLRVIFNKNEQLKIVECKYPSIGVTPAQAGYAIDGVIDDRDFMASLLYIAHEGYIRIVEYELRRFKFIYTCNTNNTKSSVSILLDMLFGTKEVGTEVLLDDIYPRIKKNMRKFKKAVYRDFNGRYRIFTTASRTANSVAILTFFFVTAMLPLMNYFARGMNIENVIDGIVAAVLFAAVLTTILALLCSAYRKTTSRRGDGNSRRFYLTLVLYVIACGIYVYLYRFAYQGRSADTLTIVVAVSFLIFAPFALMGMRNRSKKADEIVCHTLGLKQFIMNAEKQEALELTKEDPDYFFTLLPYAYLFCLSHKLASLFEFTEVDAPKWYLPYGMDEDYIYDVVIFNSMTNNLQKQLNDTVFKPNQE